MTLREIEYQALRETIRERGTTRVWIVLAGLSAWAALTLAAMALLALPLATLLPLIVLAAAFEIVFALHVGVERIGRYIQVVFEAVNHGAGSDPGEGRQPAWEGTSMAYGRQFPAGGPSPLFAGLFLAAALFNLVPAAALEAAPVEWLVIGAAHLAFVVRIAKARRYAAAQRALDLERYRHLASEAQAAAVPQAPGSPRA
jgi:hypothetical protein